MIIIFIIALLGFLYSNANAISLSQRKYFWSDWYLLVSGVWSLDYRIFLAYRFLCKPQTRKILSTQGCLSQNSFCQYLILLSIRLNVLILSLFQQIYRFDRICVIMNSNEILFNLHTLFKLSLCINTTTTYRIPQTLEM